MNSPDDLQLLRLFQKAAPASFFMEQVRRHGYQFHDGIYTCAVVVWLMIWQRLHGRRNLEAAVQHLLRGGAGSLVSGCKRWLDDRVSAGASAYCEARQRLPKLIIEAVMKRIVEQLRAEMQEGWKGLQRPVFLVDGSSLQMQHTGELVRNFPPGHNQHGKNHWPVMRIVVFHDVWSGLALQPRWGPMYGDQAVSEQHLATEAMEQLPAEAVLLGDGNFGIFGYAHAVAQSGRGLILRLTRSRAQKIYRGELLAGSDIEVVWRASRWDRKAHPELEEGAAVSGRLLVHANPCRPRELLYLFTTMTLPAAEILEIYGLRWNVETDLRSLKRSVGLHQLSSKSTDMAEKELLSAIAAYNLTRAVMCLAARRANVAPRQLSFSFVQTVVEAALPGLDQAANDVEYQQRLDRMLRFAGRGKLPKRSRRRCYPREVWGHGSQFPKRRRCVEVTGEVE
jgi:DDE family transposase